MITNVKDNINLYISLFAKASEKLGTEIQSLDQYFQKFGDLNQILIDEAGKNGTSLDESFYMLPLDEEPFYINANTREIIVPASFKRGIAVQTDHASEVLVFKIDRYFDYMDFGSPDIGIQIRYTTPDQRERYYNVGYKDLEIEPGMVRFAWILGSEVTAQPGTIKFAVRLYKTDGGKTNYIWNSKPQSSIISPVLQVRENVESDGIQSSTIFSQIISNSLNKGEIPATTPDFNSELGKNLEKTANLNADNELTLKALATKTDGGTIKYTWYYQENPNSEVVNLTEEKGYAIEMQYEAIPKESDELKLRYLARDYYKQLEDGSYKLYTDSIPAPEDVTLYKQYTTYKIEDSEETVIGDYWVVAKNALGEDGKNVSTEGRSYTCNLAGPMEPTVVGNGLTGQSYIVKTNTNEAEVQYFSDEVTTVNTYSISEPLHIEFKATPDAFYTYSWKKDGVEVSSVDYSNSVVPKNGIVTLEYKPESMTDANDIVGFYTVKFETKKNRDVKGIEENGEARITNEPILPEVDKTVTAQIEEDDSYTLNVTVKNFTTIQNNEERLRYDGEGMHYAWYRIKTDENNKEGSLIQEGVLTKEADSVLNINRLDAPCIYYCKVTNTLNNQTTNPDDAKTEGYLVNPN